MVTIILLKIAVLPYSIDALSFNNEYQLIFLIKF